MSKEDILNLDNQIRTLFSTPDIAINKNLALDTILLNSPIAPYIIKQVRHTDNIASIDATFVYDFNTVAPYIYTTTNGLYDPCRARCRPQRCAECKTNVFIYFFLATLVVGSTTTWSFSAYLGCILPVQPWVPQCYEEKCCEEKCCKKKKKRCCKKRYYSGNYGYRGGIQFPNGPAAIL